MKNDRVRLLFVLSEFMYGSKVRQLCDLVNGLDKNVFDIEVGALELGNEATGEVEALDVPYYQLRLHPPRSLKSEKYVQFLRSPLTLRRREYDLVHSLVYQSLFIEPLLVKGFTRAKYVYTKTNLAWQNHRLNWNLKSRLADRIVSVSKATDDLLSGKGFADKSVRIFLGLDTEKFTLERDKVALRRECGLDDSVFVYGCAAQFLDLKRHDILIRAFEGLCEDHPNIALLMCGPNHNDAYYRRIKAMVEGSPHRKKLFLLGTLDDMPAFYSSLDCFVMPSIDETFGYVYIEAMSCGVPVIGCEFGGPVDIIDPGVNGYLANVSNVASLRRFMGIYASDHDLARVHGLGGRKKVLDSFSREAMVENHRQLYMTLIGSRGAQAAT